MEKNYSPLSGYLFLFIELAVVAAIVLGFMRGFMVASIILVPVFILTAIGFTVVDPNHSTVLVLFGADRKSVV